MLRSLESALEQLLKCMEMHGTLRFPQLHLSSLRAGKDQNALPRMDFLVPSLSPLYLHSTFILPSTFYLSPTHTYFMYAYF